MPMVKVAEKFKVSISLHCQNCNRASNQRFTMSRVPPTLPPSRATATDAHKRRKLVTSQGAKVTNTIRPIQRKSLRESVHERGMHAASARHENRDRFHQPSLRSIWSCGVRE